MTDFGFQSFSSSASTGLNYQGTWNASTNSPFLASGVGTSGDYYIVTVAGNTDLDGITDWQVGDWAIFNGTAWQKIDNSGISYQGTWDALTNNPFLQSSIGFDGHFYIVSVAGSTDLNGITTWNVGDWAIFTGGVWLKINNTSGIGGSGTTNYISKFTSSSAIGDSQLFDNGSNVGINNSSPSAKLDILGIDALATTYSLKINDSTPNNLLSIRNDGFLFVGSSAKNSYLWLQSAGGTLGLTNENGFASILANATKLFISNGGSGGNVFAQINTSNGNWLLGNPSTNVYSANLTDTKLYLQGVDATSSNFALKIDNSASARLFYISNTGNIGNLTSPATDIQFYMAGNGTNSYGYFSNGAFGVSNFCGSGGTHRTHFYSVNGGQSGFEIDFTNAISFNRIGIQLANTGVNTSNNIGVNINVENGANNYGIVVNNGLSGFGITSPTSKVHIKGVDATSSNYAIKIDNSTTTNLFSIRNDGYTELNGDFSIVDKNIILGTTTGTKIGTSTSQKLAFYNATPIIQPSAVTTPQGIATALSNLGLLAISTINSIGGSGTTNEISYFTASGTIASLTTATYPSLTELSYVKGVTSAIQTQLNNVYVPRIQSVTSSATVTPTNLNDEVVITAQAVGLTLVNPTGTAVQGQSMIIRIKDNGTARTIAYDTQYRAIGVTLPTTTVINKTLYLGLIYNSTDTKWDVIGVSQEA